MQGQRPKRQRNRGRRFGNATWRANPARGQHPSNAIREDLPRSFKNLLTGRPTKKWTSRWRGFGKEYYGINFSFNGTSVFIEKKGFGELSQERKDAIRNAAKGFGLTIHLT